VFCGGRRKNGRPGAQVKGGVKRGTTPSISAVRPLKVPGTVEGAPLESSLLGQRKKHLTYYSPREKKFVTGEMLKRKENPLSALKRKSPNEKKTALCDRERSDL